MYIHHSEPLGLVGYFSSRKREACGALGCDAASARSKRESQRHVLDVVLDANNRLAHNIPHAVSHSERRFDKEHFGFALPLTVNC